MRKIRQERLFHQRNQLFIQKARHHGPTRRSRHAFAHGQWRHLYRAAVRRSFWLDVSRLCRFAACQKTVAEVTASGYPIGLVDKINQRVERCYAPLLEQLQRLQLTDSEWSIGMLIFARDDQLEWLKGRIKDSAGVHVLSLETASSSWLWADLVWSEDMDFGLGYIPRKDGVIPAASKPTTH